MHKHDDTRGICVICRRPAASAAVIPIIFTESEKRNERNSTCYVFPGAGGKQD